MRATVAKRLRRQTDNLEVRGTKEWRKKYQALKRQHTLEQRYGGPDGLRKAQASWGAKADHAPGGKASPSNFKRNKELASHAGRTSKRTAKAGQ